MRLSTCRSIACTSLALLATLGSWAANASTALAIDHGCYSCHGAYLRDEAPKFERLSSRLSRYKGDPTAEQKFVENFRAGEMFGHIAAHERLSPESAKALVHWLLEGAR
jgi:cytochrome c